MSQILIVAAAIISLFLGLFVFIKLIMQIKKGKMQLASNYAAVYWSKNKIRFIRLIIVVKVIINKRPHGLNFGTTINLVPKLP